jgi:hypothetical protein
MDVVLLTLTLFSLAAAAAFAAVAWRVLRDDRARATARIAALSSTLDAEAGSPVAQPVAVASLFAATPGAGTSVKGHPMLKGAVVAVMAAIVVVAAAMGSSGPDTPAGQPAAAQGAAPLELMSMRHTREGSTLTVTGLVRNPPAGAQARRVSAVILAFNRDGAFVSSARAPLDFMVLEPDDESPFVVTVPDAAGVARYRVSFRTEESLVRHVDRRAEQTQIAGNQ